MKRYALLAVEKGQVALVESDLAEPGDKEIQVLVSTSIISPGTERAITLSMDNTNNQFPAVLGYSTAGIVRKTGKAVSRFQTGDRVACFCLGHCNIGNVPEDFCVKIEDAITDEEATFLALGVISMQGVRKTRIELGESVMVFGLGPVGQLAMQFARLSGALPLIGVDRVKSRIDIAYACGADHVLDSGNSDWEHALSTYSSGQGPDVVIESSGFSVPIQLSLNAVRKFGRLSLLGSTREHTTINLYETIHKKALTVTGAHIMGNPELESRPGFWTWRDDADCFMKLLSYKKLCLGPLITDRVSWQDAESLYQRLLSWDSDMMIAVMDWNR